MEKLTADTQATAKKTQEKVRRIEALVQSDKGRSQLAAIAQASKAYDDKVAEIRELHRGGEPNVPKPPNVASDRVRPPQGVRMPPKLREKHEPVEVRVGTLPVPERPYKTTFVGANPWGV